MQQLLSDIQNETFKPVYLLHGDEAYLRVQYKNRLKDALTADGDTMNYSYYQGKDVNAAEVIDMSETMPFLADKRVIILENTGFAKDGNDALADYVNSGIPDTTVIIMVEQAVDKRTRLYKAIDKAGRCVSFDIQNDDTLKKWILGRLKREGRQISAQTLDIFLETVGTDMYTIFGELEKLISYTMGRNAITQADVESVCCVRLQNRVFDMISLMGLKKSSEAVKIYHEILSLKESPYGVLALIVRQFNYMLQIGDMLSLGMNNKTIASNVGLSPYVVGKYIPQVKNFSIDEMKKILEACAETDHNVKRGDMGIELGVELLILEIATSR